MGPGPISDQIRHAEGFAACWEELRETPPRRMLDLGSGGGLPGLVLVERWNCPTVLLDSMVKRTDFLREVLAPADGPQGLVVITERAESAARRPDLAESFDLVVARSFGPPAVTSECAVRFLTLGGLLIVSEPPEDAGAARWPTEGLHSLGLSNHGRRRYGASFQVLEKVAPTPAEFPRPVGVPGKRPTF